MAILAIVGRLKFYDFDLLSRTCDKIASRFDITGVVSGGARGADTLGERWARARQLPMDVFLPDWQKYGRAGGPIRNNLIAKAADLFVAFYDGSDGGTRSFVQNACPPCKLRGWVIPLTPEHRRD